MAGMECSGIAKAIGRRPLLEEISFTVPEGTLTAVLGASGSGKTTLLRILMGFVRADAGAVRVGDRLVTEVPGVHVAPEKRGIGYVAQEGALFPHLTVRDNVGFGLSRQERRQGARIAEAMEMVGLGAAALDRPPHELSGGEQRRVALARALAPRPSVILLDEPFSGLDAALRAETRTAVLAALAGAGATAIMVTHDQAEAMSMGDEVALLRDGRLVQTGRPPELYHRPVDLDAARFLGDAVVLRGRAAGSVVSCSLGALPMSVSPGDGDVEVMLRPEQITVAAPASPGGVRAEVSAVDFFGARTVVTLNVDGEAPGTVRATVFSHEAPGVGDRVVLGVSGTVVAYRSGAAVARDAAVGEPAP